MNTSFDARMTELIDRVGIGDLVGHVVVDQVYAHRQHEDLTYRHPHGGEAQYLRRPLYDNRTEYLELIALSVLDDGGKAGMIESMENLALEGGVMRYAPIEWGDLRRSGHPFVTENNLTVYDRPPLARRLTEAELDAKARLTPEPGALLGYLWWHVEHHQHPPDWKGFSP